MNVISSSLSSINLRETFSLTNLRESYGYLPNILLGATTYTLVDYYRRHNFYCISDRNKLSHQDVSKLRYQDYYKEGYLTPYYPKIAKLAAVTTIGMGILAAATYSRFKTDYFTFAQALSITALNILKPLMFPSIGVAGGIFLFLRDEGVFVKRIREYGPAAEIATPIVCGILGIVATIPLVKYFPLKALSSNQAHALFVASIGLGILGLPYENNALNDEDGNRNWTPKSKYDYEERKWLGWGKVTLLTLTTVGAFTSLHTYKTLYKVVDVVARTVIAHIRARMQ